MSNNPIGQFEFSDEEGSYSGGELNFNFLLLRQIERISFHLTRLNETPSYCWNAFANHPEINFSDIDTKPNKLDFVNGVLCLESLLYHKLDSKYKDAVKKVESLSTLKNQEGVKDESKKIQSAILRFRELIELMKRESLLPTERMR